MNTLLLSENSSDILTASELIKKGEVVGFPTETVYGLGANALDENAVRKIFEAKGRPSDNPLIVHISDIEDMSRYVEEIPPLAYKLAEKFWPGPLTMVMKKNSLIPDVTSGGLDTVGIRLPINETARSFIRACGVPIAAPSANLSGSPSPTTADHVISDMNGRVSAIIRGSDCPVGVESTVVCFDADEVVILRPGFVSAEDIRDEGMKVRLSHGITEELGANEKAMSPGMKYKHYSPKANVTIVDSDYECFVSYVNAHGGDDVFALGFEETDENIKANYESYGKTSDEQARLLFSRLREMDEKGIRQVYVRCPSTNGIGLAVYNRLLRAAAFEVIKP